MKKNYKAPKTLIFKAEIKHMIAASPFGSANDEYNSSDTSYSNEGGSWFSED